MRTRSSSSAARRPQDPSKETPSQQVRAQQVRAREVRAQPSARRDELQRRTSWLGPAGLSETELIALVLDEKAGDDAAIERAEEVVRRIGGLKALKALRPAALRLRGGLDETSSYRLAAALELGVRIQRAELLPPADRPVSSESVINWARPRLAGLEHEEVWVLCVNSHTALSSAFQVGRGGIAGCGLLARDILVPVVRDGASGFILVHNHPSGDPTPSREDIELTRGLRLAAASLCIPLLDHVVVASGGARSLFELGHFDG